MGGKRIIRNPSDNSLFLIFQIDFDLKDFYGFLIFICNLYGNTSFINIIIFLMYYDLSIVC